MNSVDRVKAVCKEKKIPVYKLERDLGYANGYISQLKKGTFPAERLHEIAEYIGVSVDYLLTGEDSTKKSEPAFYFIPRETAEIAQELHDRPELYMMFKTLRKASPESLKLTAEVIEKIVKAQEAE